MGYGSCLKIVNNTPYSFTKTASHSYQMDQWGPFPDSIAAGTSSVTYYERDASIFDATDDDSGDVTYQIDDGAGGKLFHFHQAVSPPYPDVELTNWTAPVWGSGGSLATVCGTCAGYPSSKNPTWLLQIGGSGDALTLTTGSVAAGIMGYCDDDS